ncbi:DNA polymerase III PolC-type [Corynebacterium urogenitale]|uniref:DNA polymerase III PolC-type n=1 Tax=Corynebacterium urogenitale TaxID=2487892 RepID=A0A5J6ZB19_9CORY|nr:exonuclease domain-containing protein [Corynebacterium urogenitale]QFQ02835.1 DNA polymerase III PolC-type [Corynebacterium urogenitale]
MVAPKKFAVLDFETTGFGHTDRVIEAGVVLLDHNHQVERTWETLIQPNRDISNSFVHHITAGDVVDAPTFEQISGELAGLLNGRTLVAHNAPFEVRFLRREFGRAGLAWPAYGAWIIDTMRLVKQRFPGEPSTLTHALELLGITNTRPHSALADAKATAELFTHLIEDGADLLISSAALDLPAFEYPASGALYARPSSTSTPQATPGQWLANISARISKRGTGGVEQYRKLLTAALADKELSRTEIHQLGQQAERDGLGRDDLLSMHEEFLRQIAIEAWLDGIITDEERATITTLAEQLGLSESLASELLATPQQGDSGPGIQLKVGDRVTFTGQLDLPREEWAKRAEAVGLSVGGVTKKSALLIAANPDSMSGKARKARDYGVPIVGEKTFAQLVRAMTEDTVAVEEDLTAVESANEATDYAAIFPWSSQNSQAAKAQGTEVQGATDQAAGDRSLQLAIEWCDTHAHLPLVELSPQLTTTTPVEVQSSFKSGYTQWFARFEEPLTAAVNDLRDLRGVGEHKLHKMVEAVVLAAIDSHASASTTDAEHLDGFYEDEQHAEHIEEFAGTVEDAPHSGWASGVGGGRTGSEWVGSEWAGSEWAGKARAGSEWAEITLFAGWNKLINVCADMHEIPEAVRATMPALVERLSSMDPVLEVFKRAAEDVRVATEADPRKLTIVSKRLIGGASLEEVGAEFGVTRERVRQLESQWKQRFQEDNGFFTAVVEAIHQRVRPVARVSAVRENLPALANEVEGLGCTYSELFVALGERWDIANGWATEPGFAQKLGDTLQELSDDYGVATVHEVADALGVPAEVLEGYIVTSDELKVIIVDDKVLTKVSSHQDRAVSVLAINGEPMQAQEIIETTGGGNIRSAQNQFAIDPRLVKISADQWALADWGMEEFKSIASWIGQRVRTSARTYDVTESDGTQRKVPAVALSDLLAEAGRLQVSEQSIRQYASLGDFETRDGMVFERIDETGNTIEGDIEDTRDVYLRGDVWHLLVTVTKDHLRGSGFPVPLGVAAFYGLKVGEELALDSRLGEQYVRVNRLKQASMSTIRRFLEDLGVREGERVWLRLGEDKTFDVTKAPDNQPNLEGMQWVYSSMGLDPQLVVDGESVEDSLARVNAALGLEPSAPRRRTVAMFRHRRQDDIADVVREL